MNNRYKFIKNKYCKIVSVDTVKHYNRNIWNINKINFLLYKIDSWIKKQYPNWLFLMRFKTRYLESLVFNYTFRLLYPYLHSNVYERCVLHAQFVCLKYAVLLCVIHARHKLIWTCFSGVLNYIRPCFCFSFHIHVHKRQLAESRSSDIYS